MDGQLAIILLTLLAGATIPLGGLLASFESIQPRWMKDELRHFIIAFGGGALLAAVALVLVPEGIKAVPVWQVALWMVTGSLAFMGLDLRLAKNGSPAAQLTAMLADFVPEALALGAAAAGGGSAGLVLALLIALQNLPEGFNSFREVRHAGNSTRHVLLIFCMLTLLGPICGLTGYHLLAGHDALIGAIMLFASGGILYLVFQDIAPQAKLARHWTPPLGAVAGFLLGLIGELLLNPG
ncbi:ZIP family metal transporter [Haloferula helveola]|uniref:ZIP family metal transporter n=1 Tax=Haloferula helveola TaxID=490095 RepID=A0ABN6GZG9_9BACT|nr:ZIP family metal transporter [Haloferula helveola]